MLLQSGRFVVKNMKELESRKPDSDGLKKVIDLDYIGQFEYETNTILILRMLMEYRRNEYQFYPLDIFNKNDEQMIMFAILEEDADLSCLSQVAWSDIDKNYSLYRHINHPNEEFGNDFWWNINHNYMIFFGKEKIDLINYFLDSTYTRDGGKEEIVKKLAKVGIKPQFIG